MRQARMEDITYFKKMGVYDKVSIEEAWKETSCPQADTPASVRPAQLKRSALRPSSSGKMASCRQPSTVGLGALACHAKPENAGP